eukprot:scaffold29236_cov120-Isochrysis_galbana.AAC.1
MLPAARTLPDPLWNKLLPPPPLLYFTLCPDSCTSLCAVPRLGDIRIDGQVDQERREGRIEGTLHASHNFVHGLVGEVLGSLEHDLVVHLGGWGLSGD